MKTMFHILSVLLCSALLLAACAPANTVSQADTATPVVTETPAEPAFPTSRDPIYWPFPADSIWNMPIHNDAVYVDSGLNQHMPMEAGPTTDQEILILSPGSPLVPVQESNAGFEGKDRCDTVNLTGSTLFEAPIPDNWSTGGGPDGNMSSAVLLADGVTIIESQPLHVCSEGGLVTSAWAWDPTNIRTSDGIAGSHGGSGMSSLGGSLRYNELIPGSIIRHALKMNFYAKYAYSYTGDTPGHRWPAPQADGYASAETFGGKVLAMEEGSLLALKPDFDLSSLQTEPARIIAQAAQNYGIYAVDDTAWDVFGLDVEWGTDGAGNRSVLDQFQGTYGYGLDDGPKLNCTETTDACKFSQDMWNIISHLKVIDNNTPNTIGGGPNSDVVNRRAPVAPPFIPIQPTATPTFGPSPTPRPTFTASPTPLPTATPELGWVIVDDAAPDVWTFTGSFGGNIVDNSNNLGGTQRDPWQDGDSAETTFTGTQVKVYGVKFGGAVTADIYIDDMTKPVEAGVSWDNPTTVYRSLIWASPVLSSGKHTLLIICRGDYISFDYISYK